jgi:diguanylate cyclase (GGDEF)-like protein
VTEKGQPTRGFILMIVKIALVALVVETVIMLGFYWLGMGLSNWKFALLDAGLLAILVAIIAHYAFVRPKDRQIQSMMAALEEARLKAEELARFDSLTGVLSRRAILEALDEEVERARRHGDGLACLMLDLDHFKTFNDRYGHQFGDRVLRRVARVIAELCRAYDHLGRYGGEEFLLILPETRVDGAVAFAERVRHAVAATALNGNDERITLSIGVTEWLSDDGSPAILVAEADQALFEAKAAGRNQVVVHAASGQPY